MAEPPPRFDLDRLLAELPGDDAVDASDRERLSQEQIRRLVEERRRRDAPS